MEKVEFTYENGVLIVDATKLQLTSPKFKNEIMNAVLKASAENYKNSGKTQIAFCSALSKHINHQITFISEKVFYNREG